MRLTKLLSALVLTTASSVIASAAMAQTAPQGFEPVRTETLSDAFNRAFSYESGTSYTNNTLLNQANYILGFGVPGRAGFPDLQLERDARRIEVLYRDAFDLQVSSDPVLRTPDLPNPFNSSLRLQPGARGLSSRVEGSEFVYETVPSP